MTKGEKLDLFERDFVIDEMTGVTLLGIKFSVSLFSKRFFQYGYPEGKIRILEGAEMLNPGSHVHFQIDYTSGEEKGTISFKQTVEKLKEDFYFQTNPSALDQGGAPDLKFNRSDNSKFLK